jgi:hypothetical protein
MTTGTTTNYSDTRNQIITDALILLGIMSADDSLSANDVDLGTRFLNRIIKYWQASGAQIWTNSYATLWLSSNVKQYSLGTATTDAHWSNSYVETILDDAALIAATSLNLSPTTAMTVGDTIGIVLDDGTIHWTTIATIPNSTSVTITVGLAYAAASGNYVYTYTSRAARPLRMLNVSRREGQLVSTSELLMVGTSFYDYQMLTNKFSQGIPVQWVYDPRATSGLLTLWPVPTDMTQRLSLHYTRPLFDFDSGTDTADTPQEWLQCLVYTLAASLAPAYGRTNLLAVLKSQADDMFYAMDNYDQETISVYLTPTNNRY